MPLPGSAMFVWSGNQSSAMDHAVGALRYRSEDCGEIPRRPGHLPERRGAGRVVWFGRGFRSMARKFTLRRIDDSDGHTPPSVTPYGVMPQKCAAPKQTQTLSPASGDNVILAIRRVPSFRANVDSHTTPANPLSEQQAARSPVFRPRSESDGLFAVPPDPADAQLAIDRFPSVRVAQCRSRQLGRLHGAPTTAAERCATRSPRTGTPPSPLRSPRSGAPVPCTAGRWGDERVAAFTMASSYGSPLPGPRSQTPRPCDVRFLAYLIPTARSCLRFSTAKAYQFWGTPPAHLPVIPQRRTLGMTRASPPCGATPILSKADGPPRPSSRKALIYKASAAHTSRTCYRPTTAIQPKRSQTAPTTPGGATPNPAYRRTLINRDYVVHVVDNSRPVDNSTMWIFIALQRQWIWLR
ncbi:hypothetical protein KIPE111705_02795 [Kibdelosporangium persicum]